MTYAPVLERVRDFASGAAVCVAGVDLGARAIKVAIAKRRGTRRTIVAAARIVSPPNAEGGPRAATDPVRQAALLGQWMRHWCAFRVDAVVCSLPSTFTDYEAIDSDQGSPPCRGADEGLEQVLGPAAADATGDYWRTHPNSGGAPTTHLVWAGSAIAHAVPREFARWGLACRVLEAAPSAIAAVGQTKGDQSRLVVDLGDESAICVLVEHGQAVYVRPRVSLPTRGAVDQLAGTLRISRPAAETVLSEWGCDEAQGKLARQVQTHLDGWLRALLFEVERTIVYLTHREDGAPLEEIVLCGGGSAIRGVGAWLEARLGVPTRVAESPAGARWSAAEPYSPMFAQATALALREDLI
ncbi:Competence protein A [Pirellulimonas nuda]|uniref:Competence protein A n=1 Tax=Pirellulimonas nuda TaxID=2528009 RepID=A0A518DFX4_9BACT|nr:hypothetical protein [Pirellulimonas nuda]QDU90380.1 Competence protein A [Pirellulimonas nuda]